MRKFELVESLVATALVVVLLAACGRDGTTTAERDDPTTIVEGTGQQKLEGSDVYTLKVSATEKAGEVSGSGSIAQGGVEERFSVECSAKDGEIVMVGGTFDDGERAGTRVALLIKDLNPDRVTVWFEDPPPADDCDSMVGNIPPDVIANDSFYTPLKEGNFSLTGPSTVVNSASGNTVANWSAFLDEASVSACAGPKVEGRMAATMNIAVSDALNAIAPRTPQIAFHGRELTASARSAVAAAASTSLVEVLRSAPGLSVDCRRTSIASVERAAAASMAALPDRPGTWIGVVLGKAAAKAALSWTGKHPAACDLVPMRLARVEADEHGLTMWETAALLTDRSTTIC